MPWGTNKGSPIDGIGSDAQWIWTAGSDTDQVVYCRFTINEGQGSQIKV